MSGKTVRLEVLEFSFSAAFGARTIRTKPDHAMVIDIELQEDEHLTVENDVVVLNLKGCKVLTNSVTDALREYTDEEREEAEAYEL